MPAGEPATFIEIAPSGGHRLVLGGLTTLERVIRTCGKAGVTRVEVPSEPLDVARGGRAHGVEVTWLPPGSQPAAGQPTVRGDEIAGVRVVDEATRRDAEWRLIRGLSKSFQGPTDAWLNWRFSMPLTRFLARTPVTPNMITIAGTLGGFLGWLLILTAGAVGLAVAGVLLQVHSILDSTDGELARLRFQFSKLGEWLDNVTDELVDDGFAVCCGIAAGGPWFWLGLLGGARSLAVAYQIGLTYARTGSGSPYAFRWWFERQGASAEEAYDRRTVLFWIRALGRRDTYVLLWMFLALAGQPQAIAAYAAVLAAMQLGMTLVDLPMRALGRTRQASQ